MLEAQEAEQDAHASTFQACPAKTGPNNRLQATASSRA
jgi:hypothetical protein